MFNLWRKVASVERKTPQSGVDLLIQGLVAHLSANRRECRKEAFARAHEDRILFDILPFDEPDSVDENEVISDHENIARLAREDREIRERVEESVSEYWSWERVIEGVNEQR